MANALGQDLKGKIIVLQERFLKKEYRGLEHRLLYVDGGFGSNPNTMGGVLLCTDYEGKKVKFRGFEVERLAVSEEAEVYWALRKANENDDFDNKVRRRYLSLDSQDL